MNKQAANDYVLDMIPSEEVERVLSQNMCDIEPGFLGFMDVYYHLAQIIPEHFTVVDLGCAYAAQGYLFTEHKAYIGVDSYEGTVCFNAPNSTIHRCTIREFVDGDAKSLNMPETFAICSYVPPWGEDNMALVRSTFRNVFTYYPHGAMKRLLKEVTA